MSPGKAYVPESADLQLELLRHSWGKYPYKTKTWEKFRRESPDCNSPLFMPRSIAGGTPPVSQHCFKSGGIEWASGPFPGHWIYLHQKSLPPGMQKSEGKSGICILLQALRQQQAPSSQRRRTARQQNRLGSHPHYHQWPRPLEGPEENFSPSEASGGTPEQSVTDQGNPLQPPPAVSLHYGPVLPLPCQKRATPARPSARVCVGEGCQSFLRPAEVVMAKSSEDSHAPPPHTTLLTQCQTRLARIRTDNQKEKDAAIPVSQMYFLRLVGSTCQGPPSGKLRSVLPCLFSLGSTPRKNPF